ncbi:MAG: hypothetical protein FJ318_03235 [SAR202 cluster bacterium]|nr:hypothetical protein [SAR202 cluster bacterium]
MTIDFHTHLLPRRFARERIEVAARDATFDTLFRDAKAKLRTTEQLIAAMDEAEVDMSVAVGYGWCDPEIARESNDYLLEAAARHPKRIVPFCSVHPGWGDGALLEVSRCADAGARGIGELHPTSQQIDLAALDARIEGLMALALERRLPVMVHGSEPVGHAYAGKGDTTPGVLLAFIERFPRNDIVCAHWGGGLPFYALMPEVRAALANVYFDTAASPLLYAPRVFNTVAETLGANHILFASDYPLLPQLRVISQARSALPAYLVHAVLHGNAARLLGIGDR